MAMGPRFDDPLYFQSDGALEVCGPANFGPNDVSFELLKVAVRDENGKVMHKTPHPRIVLTQGEMWETDIENARGVLAVGPATGFARGRVTKRDGTTKCIEWTGQFDLVDTSAFGNILDNGDS
jgi:hypothetical protein